MPITDVTYRFEFGAAIAEAGLNAISAGLRISRPDLFTHSNTVVVKAAPDGQPPSAAHLLTIYAVVTKPLAFNLYPVVGLPALPPDTMMIQADISFSLTDSILGLITRIDVVAQATAKLDYSGEVATINLLSFDLVDIEGDLPAAALPAAAGQTADGLVPVGTAVLAQITSDALGDSFRAIINYMVELFLKDTLETAVASFPVPSLDKLIGFGGLGTIPIAGLFIRNKTFYLMSGNDLGAPAAFPLAPATPPDIAIGLSQTGVRRALAAFLPMPVPIDVGSGSALHLTGNLSINRLDVTLPPGSNNIPVQVNIGGPLNLHVAVPIPIFGGTLEFDVPIPIDYLSGYTGRLFPTLTLDAYPANPNAAVTVSLAPDVSFLGDWVLYIVTDYRDYLAQHFRDAVNNAANQLLGSKFCNIPILGWIVCGTISVAADVLGYLLGAVLDFWASTILTALVNIIGRVLFLFMAGPTFNVLSFKQDDLFKAGGISLKSALLQILDNGRDGDLQLSAWIQDQGLPIPAVPGPVTPLPPPQPAPAPAYPGAPALIEYTKADFAPVFVLPVPAWTDGVRMSYSVAVNSPNHPEVNATFAAQFLIEQISAGWRLSLITHAADGTAQAECRAEYDAMTTAPRTLQRISYGPSITTRQSVDLTQAGQAAGSFGIDGVPSRQLTIPTLQGVSLDCEDFWPFRLAYSPLALVAGSRFGTIAIADPHSASNWIREIPVTLDITQENFSWGPAGGVAAISKVWSVTAVEEGKQTTVKIAQDGRGILQQTVTTTESSIVMTLQG